MADWSALLVKNPEKVLAELKAKPTVDKRPAQRRLKMLEGIDRTLGQLAAKEEAPKRGWYSRVDDMAKVTVKAGRAPVQLGGHDFGLVPFERATDFYKAIRADVEAGKFDQSIALAYGDMDAKPAAKKTRVGWSPERRAAFEASKKKK